MNNHYAKFEYKGMKLLELQITQTRTPPPPLPPFVFRMEKMSKFNTRKICENIFNVHKIEGAHLQCATNHIAKFEYK